MGVSWGSSKINFLPHFKVSEHIALSNIEEPLWWQVSHSKEIESMLTDLTLCIRNKMEEKKFLEIHPNSNKYKVTNFSFDYEGFVFYADFNGVLDYGKIKTNEYYNSHKYRAGNIKYLMELSQTASNIFPICKQVSDFYGNLKTTIPKIINLLVTEINKEEKDNLFFQTLPQGKARDNFFKRPLEVQYRMYINTSTGFSSKARELFNQVYPALKSSKSDTGIINDIIKGIIMTVKPWDSQTFDKNIASLVSNCDINIANMFEVILNQGNSDSE